MRDHGTRRPARALARSDGRHRRLAERRPAAADVRRVQRALLCTDQRERQVGPCDPARPCGAASRGSGAAATGCHGRDEGAPRSHRGRAANDAGRARAKSGLVHGAGAPPRRVDAAARRRRRRARVPAPHPRRGGGLRPAPLGGPARGAACGGPRPHARLRNPRRRRRHRVRRLLKDPVFKSSKIESPHFTALCNLPKQVLESVATALGFQTGLYASCSFTASGR